jgi:hypothetical protein
MDYVYICRDGENEELKYSIRSVVANGNPDKIWVVGGKPVWYSGDYIQVLQTANKHENELNSLKEVLKNNEISDDFVLMNDDFFILKQLGSIPTYNGGLLEAKIKEHTNLNGVTRYSLSLKEVKKQLLKKGIKVMLNYDIHIPMVMNKTKLKQFNQLPVTPRSLYGNVFNLGGKTIEDPKIYDESSSLINLDGEFVSTTDKTFILIKDKLQSLFPNKSKYEK